MMKGWLEIERKKARKRLNWRQAEGRQVHEAVEGVGQSEGDGTG